MRITRISLYKLAIPLKEPFITSLGVDTDALKHFPNRDELLGESEKRTPTGRLTTPDDVNRTSRLLAGAGIEIMLKRVSD